MRGNIKTNEYFEELLKRNDGNIERFLKAVEKACQEHGEDFKGVKNGYGILEGEYSKRFNILYTLGSHDEMLPETFAELLKYTVLTWNADSYSYWDLIKVLSLAILMKTDSENRGLMTLLDMFREAEIKDYLVDNLCMGIDPSWPHKCDSFLWKNTFEPLKPVFEDPDGDAIGKIDEFLRKRWMIIHKGAWWYGGHNNDKKPYYGYWAYECAAAVRILGLDDATLNGQKWYPYDLAHMNN